MKNYRRIYAIPDIHGRLDLLDKALELLDTDGFDKETDVIVFLGDYIDRGPESCKVVSLVKKLVDSGEALAVCGNHEDFAINYYAKNGNKDIWLYNGGWQTLNSYQNDTGVQRMSDEDVKFLGSLPISIELQGFFFSHAPVPREKHRMPGEKGEPYTRWDLTWYYFGPEGDRAGGLMDKHEGPASQFETGKNLVGICGHIHRGPKVTEIRQFPNYRMLDCGSGCFPTGSLAVHECISGKTMYAKPGEDSNG